ncbi:MAG: sigma-70 family RNA polymerase sigma factor [Phycisphaerales bacterium]|nr:sigma-70 family RNA polymerase sigma factor [Phycisphaerales bacterium]
MPVDARGALVLRLFEEFYERVYFFARRSVDQATAEDVAQEVFVRLLDKDDLESRPMSVSYLIKIADNLIKRRHRRLKKLEEFISGELQRFEHRECGAPDQGDSETAGLLGQLPAEEQDAVGMIVCRDLSYEATALALDVKISTVNNWKYRGIQRLKQSQQPGPAPREKQAV